MNYVHLISDSSFKFSFMSGAMPSEPGKSRMFYANFIKFTKKSFANRMIGFVFGVMPNWWAHVTS